MKYVIRNRIDPTLFWSDDYGWVIGRRLCDEFTCEETGHRRLPMDGEWEQASGDPRRARTGNEPMQTT